MKKLFIIGILIGISNSSYATEPLDSVFNKLESHKNAIATEVKYSGSFSDDCQGFIFQRGEGNGWTKGVRLTIPCVKPEEAQNIKNLFDATESEVGFVIKSDSQRASLDEREMTAYAFDYDSVTKTLYFLRASVENEICIPFDWQQRDYHYSPASPISVNWTEALARLYTEIKYNSAFYDKIASRLDSVYNATLIELQGTDDYGSYRLLQKLAAACGDGHTFIFMSRGLPEMPVSSPFTTVLLGDRLYVNTVESDELEKAGMKRGMEIIKVNDKSPQEYATRELLPYIITSTSQWAEHKMFDNYGFSEGRIGAPFNLTLTDNGGTDTIIVNHSIGSTIHNPHKAVWKKPTFNITKDNIALLTLPDFSSSEVVNFFDSVYPRILESKALAIDLRGNEGGNSSFGDHILRHLSKDSIATNPWRTPIYMPAYASWGKSLGYYEAPSRKIAPIEDKTPYVGPVVVLTDRGTFSAAEDFCSVFKGMQRGLIVGTPTGGSTGNGVSVRLTNGINANICAKHDFMPDGTEFVGIGIIPDIIIEETPESYFSNSIDIVLEKALSTLTCNE